MPNLIKIRDFSKGLWLNSPEDEMPAGTLRRARGIHPLSLQSVRSRFGSTLLHSVNAHSISRFNDVWYYGASTAFYAGAVSIKASLGGGRLATAKAASTAGVADRLYIAGGTELFKIDDTYSVVNSAYIWTKSGETDEYYLMTVDSSDPGLAEPDALLINNDAATVGTVGELAAGEWAYDDNDTLGYDTIYVRLSDDGDPDDEADDYIKAIYVQNWGISPPEETLIAADGGAGGNLDDGAVYKYRLTYYNSRTGVRSNPAAAPPDAYTKLLLHCEGDDEGQVFTDSSESSHTVTPVNDAKTDAAQKKFGTTSGCFDGTGDYLSVADYADWHMGTDEFTIDFWVRFNALPTSTNAMQFFDQYADANNRVQAYVYNITGTYRIYLIIESAEVQTVLFSYVWTPSVDAWYHLAFIRGWGGDSDSWELCVNGVGKANKSSSTSWPDLAAAFTIGGAAAGSGLNGWIDEFRVSKGIARWTENFTVPAAAYGSANIDLEAGSTSVDLSNIPESSDAQVTHVEIWRTAGGDTSYFLLTRIANGTATYTDDISDDDLASVELPTTNLKPYAWFDDCYGEHNASMFWITRTQSGEKGRLYYSPIGRSESIEGYINVTSDADPLQKLFGWRGYLAVISTAGIYQILGTNPYVSKKVAGAPGTSNPHTVAMTPSGLIYESDDGVRIFDGSSSRLLNFQAVGKIFRGISVGDLTSFSGVVGAYARGEYFISDASQTLAVDLISGRWRDLGVGVNAFCYAEDDDILAATISSTVLDFEDEGTLEDNTTDLTFAVEPAHQRLSEDKKVIVQRVHVDANAASETLTVYLLYDGTATSLGTVTSAARAVTTLNAGKLGRVVGVRITGSVDKIVEIFGIDIEV